MQGVLLFKQTQEEDGQSRQMQFVLLFKQTQKKLFGTIVNATLESC